MYKAIEMFADLKDEEPSDDRYAIQYHVYAPGDIYPREGMTADAERLTELESKGLIRADETEQKAAPEAAEKPTETAKRPARKRTRKVAE